MDTLRFSYFSPVSKRYRTVYSIGNMDFFLWFAFLPVMWMTGSMKDSAHTFSLIEGRYNFVVSSVTLTLEF